MLNGCIHEVFHCGATLSSPGNTLDYLSCFYILHRSVHFYVVIHIYKFLKESFCLLEQFKFIGEYIFMNVLSCVMDSMNTHLVT